jgi:lipoate-protein ligase A
VEVIDLPGHDPQANLDFEEALFNRLKGDPHPALLFYVNAPCVVLGRSNKAAEWVDEAALAADGVPLLRRFTGGGAVYHDEHNLNFSFLMPRAMLDVLVRCRPACTTRATEGAGEPAPYGPRDYIAFFRSLVISALERGSGQGGYAQAGVSDITLNGRKISGNAQRIASSLVLHHGTLLLRCPMEPIERYLRVPPNRPGVPHRGFITGLWEEGREHRVEELKQWVIAESEKRLSY